MRDCESLPHFNVADITSIFFFQAEDGIRDPLVTGVQTCALPISAGRSRPCRLALFHRRAYPGRDRQDAAGLACLGAAACLTVPRRAPDHLPPRTSDRGLHGAGRASEGGFSSVLLRG